MLMPVWTPMTIAAYAAFATFVLSMGIGEHVGIVSARYSKFRIGTGFSARAGMLLIYAVPLLVAAAVTLQTDALRGPRQWVGAAVVLHFGKRCAETLWLHRYSGPIDLQTVLIIVGFYTSTAGVIVSLPALTDRLTPLGAALFLVGEALNFAHHKLLADQRGETTAYVIPRGGLFGYVACPHYLGEAIAWLGIAVLSRHLFTALAVTGMVGLLIARSLKTLAWYQERFPDWPRARKALIPGLL
jgi:3-oxo-5-alpha-steroid 4-dehydrogenase 1